MKDNTNKQFWEKFAFLYTSFMRKNDTTYDNISDELKKYLKSDMRVLEIIIPKWIQGIGKIKKCAFAV